MLTAEAANNLFLSAFNSLPPTSLSIFCDGSLSQQHCHFCRSGSSQRENAQHILIGCPRLVRHRVAFLRLFSHLNLPLTLEFLLGLHPSISCQQQLTIRNALTTYHANCKLIESIWIVLAFYFVSEQGFPGIRICAHLDLNSFLRARCRDPGQPNGSCWLYQQVATF